MHDEPRDSRTARAPTPIWHVANHELERTPLAQSRSVSACVVGAGIFGLTTAYLLQRAGRPTVVLDDGPIAGGQTARTTAHLATAVDGRYASIERIHGRDAARHVAHGHAEAIATIERIVRDEQIACDLLRLDGFLCVTGAAGDARVLQQEHDAAAHAGVEVELMDRAPVASFDGPCLRFGANGRIDPLRYLAGLARAFERAGGTIHTGTRVTSLHGGAPAIVRTDGGHEVLCEAVVVATGTPICDRFILHAKQSPYMTYVLSAPVGAQQMPDVLLWDTAEPYHYVRLAGGRDAPRLIVGGEDHKTGQASDGEERFARLERWARAHFPSMGPVERRWAGQVFEPADGLAFIGRDPLGDENVFVATGFSGNGFTYGTLAAQIVGDLVCGKENPWQSVWDPGRLRAGALGRLVRENLNVAAQYADWLRPGDVADESAIAPGSGAIVRHGLDRIAAYRDSSGTLHRCHAACPHLGCAVAWNPAESTWDCPCHGSRFTATGRVIVGPANRDLARLETSQRDGDHADPEHA
jgi:glycine/D-amino acid oxidase-like deaminating enzyme/nitrite reductase/ring-hydroxylating ferredoxin subunit